MGCDLFDLNIGMFANRRISEGEMHKLITGLHAISIFRSDEFLNLIKNVNTDLESLDNEIYKELLISKLEDLKKFSNILNIER